MNIIPFGSLVRDKITGFEGVIVYRVEHMNNCVRYGVQPMVDKDGKLPESKVLEGPNLEITAPAKEDLSPTIKTSNTFKLGVKVKDCLTGLTGIVVVRLKERHSGDRYGIQSSIDAKGEIPDIRTFDEEDLEQIDPPVSKKRRKKTGKNPPNGPHNHNTAIAR